MIGSAALNIGIIGYAVVYMPLVRMQPVCVDKNVLLFPFSTEVDGEMAQPFFLALHHAMAGMNHWATDGRIYVTIADWFDRAEMKRLSNTATSDLLIKRTGVTSDDLFYQRAGVPEFDEVIHRPPCSAVRKLAIKGGEWAQRGPELKPEVARGRIVPLPHLTDPLLFEPVRPREPEAANGKGDARPR